MQYDMAALKYVFLYTNFLVILFNHVYFNVIIEYNVRYNNVMTYIQLSNA